MSMRLIVADRAGKAVIGVCFTFLGNTYRFLVRLRMRKSFFYRLVGVPVLLGLLLLFIPDTLGGLGHILGNPLAIGGLWALARNNHIDEGIPINPFFRLHDQHAFEKLFRKAADRVDVFRNKK